MVGPPSSRWSGQMGTMTFRSMRTMQDPDFFEGEEFGSVEGY